MNTSKVAFISLTDLADKRSIAGHKQKVAACQDEVRQAEAILSFEMSQQGIRGYDHDRIKQAQYNVDGKKHNLRKAEEAYTYALENTLDDKSKLVKYAQGKTQHKECTVTFTDADAWPFTFTIGSFTYRFTRPKCIAIVKELRDGKWHKMKKPTPLFQNDAKTVKRQKKDQRGGVTTEKSTTQGEHARFCEKHLENDKTGNWRIALHKQKTS